MTASPSSNLSAEFADLVLFNGVGITLTRAQPRATAIAFRDGKIVVVGSDRDVRAMGGPGTRLIDLQGKTFVPGFCDAHIHLAGFGMTLMRQADLAGVGGVDELLARLDEHARASGRDWIEGRGFDQERMGESGFRWPTRADLDRVFPNQPAIITRVCGHAAVVNSAALRLVSPDARAGGDLETGLYTENAIAPFRALIPELTDTEMNEGIGRAARAALRTGITSVGSLLDEGVEGLQLASLSRLRQRGDLPLRVTAMPPASVTGDLHERGIATGHGDDWLRVGGAKFFSDGSLGARTALLACPYADGEPGNLGIRIHEPQTLKERMREVQERGYQIVVHAIGDQAIRECLDAIEYALDSSEPDGDNGAHRHRIEHASVLPPDLLARMADRGIPAVIQPQFVRSDSWAGERLGPDRLPWMYPFRAMRDAGIYLALSSDCPVEPVDAFACLDTAVNRPPWLPHGGGLTVEEALHDYCLGSAFALHAESHLGSLEVGKYADVVVLSDDPTRVSKESIRSLKAERVFVEGREVTLTP